MNTSNLSVVVNVTSGVLAKQSADAFALLHTPHGIMGRTEDPEILEATNTFLDSIEDESTESGRVAILPHQGTYPARLLLLESITFGPRLPGREMVKGAGARIAILARRQQAHRLVMPLEDGDSLAPLAKDIYEGAVLGDFLDDRFRGDDRERPLLRLTFHVPEAQRAAVQAALESHRPVLEGHTLARYLVNTPHNILTPEELVDEARRVGDLHGMDVEVLDEEELLRQDYRLLSAVGQGSDNPPRMIVLRYRPAQGSGVNGHHVALLGKGMTYDSGGYSIKTPESMARMNGDMGGAAAVLGAMHVVGAKRLPMQVTAIIPTAHNAIDAKAFQPGCILTHKSGKSIFVADTDAEGRLILADGLHRAGEEGANVIIDFATLTGSASNALGPSIAALFTEDESLRQLLLRASEESGDSLWHLPLWREYEPTLRHPLADLQNLSTLRAKGGAIHAANFLRQFLPEGARWAHVDMAGCNSSDTPWRYLGPGATGFGVRLLAAALDRAVKDSDL